MSISGRIITGIVLLILGVVLFVMALFFVLWIMIYAFVCFIFGLIILFNKKEDEIEQIHVKGGKLR